MDWHKPYHSESSSSRSHGKSFGSEITRDFVKPEVKEASVFSRIKKPFMPSTWKWMRTSGPAKVFTYQPRLGETTTLELDVPNQFWSFVRSVRDGKKFVGKKIHMDDNSYLEMGNRVTVNMEDAEGGSTATTFPSLEFRTSDEKGGEVFQLDWQAFAQERKLARGAWDEDWGYPKSGSPTLGGASMYDKDLKLSWNSTLSWIWLLVAAIGLLGLVKLFRK
jgi:hypothetical protein